MCSLLSLPRELRDIIWAEVCQRNSIWSLYGYEGSRKQATSQNSPSRSSSPLSLLRTCRQICHEVTPFLYQTVCVNLIHPHQTVRWIQSISPRSSSCIRHLVLRFTSLLLCDWNEYVGERKLAWSAALRCLPNLLSFTFEFQQDLKVSPIWAPNRIDLPPNDPVIGNELASSAAAWAKTLQPSMSTEVEAWEYQPERNSENVTNAMLAIDENIAPLLYEYLAKLFDFPTKSSLEHNITGLPADFFAKCGFYLSRTYAFNEDPEKPSVTLCFSRLPRKHSSSASKLHIVLDGFPHLLYLRVGCRNVDSSFLIHVPIQIRTLDVAFTDNNPTRIATNLLVMRTGCEKLFTLAIAVSPLHDRELLDEKEEKFFNRKSMSEDIAIRWDPFWQALDNVRDSGVKVWEGEGPGFKRQKVSSITAGSI